ncbi:MAG: hypothetical protein WCQ86_05685 [Bacteroidaceae bacterium]
MMRKQTILLRIASIFSLFGVVFHLLFYRLFNWGEILNGLPTLDKAIFLTYHAICILTLLFMGVFPLLQTKDLLKSRLKYGILSFFSLFYLIRIIAEFTLFSLTPSSPIILLLCLIPMGGYSIPLFIKTKGQ